MFTGIDASEKCEVSKDKLIKGVVGITILIELLPHHKAIYVIFAWSLSKIHSVEDDISNPIRTKTQPLGLCVSGSRRTVEP